MLSSAGTSTTTAGALASRSWLRALGLTPPNDGWRADLVLSNARGSELHIEIEHSEWGVRFSHAMRSSWIRVKVTPFVHDRDDFGLLSDLPPLRELGRLVTKLERDHDITFRRSYASVQTTMTSLVPEALRWLATL